MKSKILTGLIAIFSIFLHTMPADSAMWKLHPSFDRTPVRIIDTPDFTYFFVHQQPYNKGWVGYDFPSLTLFQYNKDKIEDGITPLVHDVNLSSADMRLADYSPKGGYLIVIYNDGSLDLIGKDRKPVYIDKLKRYSEPGMSLVNSITFNPENGDAWIATDAGYMVVDAKAMTVKETKILGKSLTAINKFGDRLVAIADSKAYETGKGNPSAFSDFKPIADISAATVLMPLSDKVFGFIDGIASTCNLKSAAVEGDDWRISQLGSDVFYSLSANESLASRYETNFIPNRDGYLCYSSGRAWQLKLSKDKTKAETESITIDRNPMVLGSWDFENFWAYRDRGTFVPRHASYIASASNPTDATWTDTSLPIRPNAPAAFICTYMTFSPTHGMLVMNHGHEAQFSNNSAINPPLLSSYKDGAWELRSPAYHCPSSISANEAHYNIYNSNKNRFPVADPNGLLLDPLNPNWIFCGSMFGGIMIQDISDCNRDIIHYAASNDRFGSFSSFIALTEKSTWDTLSCFSPLTIDNNGIIWSTYSNSYTPSSDASSLYLYYMLPETRTGILNHNEPVSSNDWGVIKTKYKDLVFWSCKCLALKHAKNKNKIIICPAETKSPVIIYDHNGTLDDTSDDKFIEIFKVRTSGGELINFMNLLNVTEDPVSGKVIIGCYNKTVVFQPTDDVIDGYIKGSNLADEVEILNNLVGNKSQLNKIIFDSSDNLWISSNSQGLINISKNKINAEKFDISNSPIPSNCVYGLGWNPNTQSLMMSTKFGLAELFPNSNLSEDSNTSKIRLFPETVTPDYNGNVTISNIPYSSQLKIYNKEGELVKTLNTEGYTSIEWNLEDEDGKRVPYGIYTISLPDYTSVSIDIM